MKLTTKGLDVLADIDLDELIHQVRAIADANAEFVYTSPRPDSMCLYHLEGKPSCIVGKALWNLGVSIETLEEMDNRHRDGTNGIKDILTLVLGRGASKEYRKIRWLDIVQSQQDDSVQWSECIKAADDSVFALSFKQGV